MIAEGLPASSPLQSARFMPPAPQPAAAPRLSGTVTVLLEDDESRNLDVLETTLESPEYRLIRALTAEQALLLLLQQDFAAIVLDIQMPGLSGLELAHLIKQRRRTQHIPIIFLTAYFQEDKDVLEGNLLPVQLRKAARRALKRPRAPRAPRGQRPDGAPTRRRRANAPVLPSGHVTAAGGSITVDPSAPGSTAAAWAPPVPTGPPLPPPLLAPDGTEAVKFMRTAAGVVVPVWTAWPTGHKVLRRHRAGV